MHLELRIVMSKDRALEMSLSKSVKWGLETFTLQGQKAVPKSMLSWVTGPGRKHRFYGSETGSGRNTILIE